MKLSQAQKLESVGQLAAGIAHEINTPTQYVGDNTRFLKEALTDYHGVLDCYEKLFQAAKQNSVTEELLEQVESSLQEADLEYLREETPRALSQSLDGVDRIATIVRAMKQFSHPGTTEKTLISINEAIETTITVASNEWKYIAEMVTEFDPDLPEVLCLPGEMNQVLLNLIVNAAHAVADVIQDQTGSKGTIRISTHRKGDLVEIRIQDTGTGIPEAIRSKIFDAFFTTKDPGKGTGQGLAMVHNVVVDKHGGSIDLESEVGQGTTFILRIPIGLETPEVVGCAQRFEENEETHSICG